MRLWALATRRWRPIAIAGLLLTATLAVTLQESGDVVDATRLTAVTAGVTDDVRDATRLTAVTAGVTHDVGDATRLTAVPPGVTHNVRDATRQTAVTAGVTDVDGDTMSKTPLAAAGGATIAHPSGAASSGEEPAPSAGTGESDQVAPEPEHYVDRLIDPERLPALREDAFDRYDDRGQPRALQVEATWGFTDFAPDRETEYGAAASAFWQTDLWGAFSADGGAYKSGFGDDTSHFLTMWQRGLNVPGGWQVDNGLGVLNVPAPDLQRMQPKLFLPVQPIVGLGTDWRNEEGLRLQAASGVPGLFTVGRLSGFDTDDGRTLSASANWQVAPGWQAATSLLSTQGRDRQDAALNANLLDADSLFGAVAWSGAASRAQLNVVTTSNDLDAARRDSPWQKSSPVGSWLDLSTISGWTQHEYGAFYLDNGLTWGGQPMPSDVQGGYYRISQQRMRWNWSGSVDYLDPVSDARSDSTYLSGTTRYQATSRVGIGGSASLLQGDQHAYLARAFLDHSHTLGITRYQFNQGGGEERDTAWQAEVSHTLPTTVQRRLSVTAGYGDTERTGLGSRKVSSLSVFGSQDLTDRLSLDGTVRGAAVRGGDSQDDFSASIALNWQMSPDWQMLATYDRSESFFRTDLEIDPFPEPLQPMSSTTIESFYLTMRYSIRAGRANTVLGGGPGAAAGFINGSVFLDRNENGMRDADEPGVQNITVILHNRFSLRTDSDGHFAFPMVATGPYSIRVMPDNLPLPWRFAQEVAEQIVEVGVRQRVRVDFAASR